MSAQAEHMEWSCNHRSYDDLYDEMMRRKEAYHTQQNPVFCAGANPAGDLARLLEDTVGSERDISRSQYEEMIMINKTCSKLSSLSQDDVRFGKQIQYLAEYLDRFFFLGSVFESGRVTVRWESEAVDDNVYGCTSTFHGDIRSREIEIVIFRNVTERHLARICETVAHELTHAYLDCWSCNVCAHEFREHGGYTHGSAFVRIARIINEKMQDHVRGLEGFCMARTDQFAKDLAFSDETLPPSIEDCQKWGMDWDDLTSWANHFRCLMATQRYTDSQQLNLDLVLWQRQQEYDWLQREGRRYDTMLAEGTPSIALSAKYRQARQLNLRLLLEQRQDDDDWLLKERQRYESMIANETSAGFAPEPVSPEYSEDWMCPIPRRRAR